MVVIASVMLCPCCYNFAFGSGLGREIKIPDQLGNIQEVFNASYQISSGEPTIIQIQDAHCNYEAQKNLAKILEYLIKEYKLNLILVEGGSGDVNLDFLRGYADVKARQEVADKYLRMGKISGEEYLDITSDYKLDLYGIEDEALYNAHTASFLQVDAIREEGLRYLAGLSSAVKDLKPYIYSAELRQLEEKSNAYEEKTISLAEYCQYLKELAQKQGLNLKDYPCLVSFTETARLEKEVDFQKAEAQRNQLIKDLANLLDAKGVNELLKFSEDFKTQRLTQEGYYVYLKNISWGKLDFARSYPQLNTYISYLTLSKDVNTTGLLKEIKSIEAKIEEACLVSSDQKTLAEITKAIQILTKSLNLELAPEDYQYFQLNKSKFLTRSWVNFLSEKGRNYGLSIAVPASDIIDANLNQIERFYQLGLEREKAFIRNMADKLKASGQKLAVLITGGFHTPGITRILKDKGYSYLVVVPVITQKSDSSTYFSVLRNENNYTEENSDYEP